MRCSMTPPQCHGRCNQPPTTFPPTGICHATAPAQLSLGVLQEMIDWCISPDFEHPKDRGWFFPSFEIQELLIPQINVGKPLVDEYGATEFTTEDCTRIKGNIEYLIESGIYDRRESVELDAFGKGLVTLSCSDITNCLMKLYEAADLAETRSGVLRFLGD